MAAVVGVEPTRSVKNGTPIVDVPRLLQREKYRIHADIEYDYGGPGETVAEVTKCFNFCKSALEN